MSGTRRKYDTEFKTRIALAAFKNEKTVKELSEEFSVHPNLVHRWKKQFKQALKEIFRKKTSLMAKQNESSQEQLQKQINQLEIEVEWLKQNLKRSDEEKMMILNPEHPHLSIRRQCELLTLCRSTYYYKSKNE